VLGPEKSRISILTGWIERCLQNSLLDPRVAYGYSACVREGKTALWVFGSGQSLAWSWACFVLPGSALATAIGAVADSIGIFDECRPTD